MNAIKPKQKQTFSCKAPAAVQVLLAGDFTHWLQHPIPLQKHGDIWSATVSLTPGAHQYRFVVDGEWRDDPECKLRVPNCYGSENDLVEVGEAAQHVHEGKPTGTLARMQSTRTE